MEGLAPRSKVAVVNVLLASGRHIRSATTGIKASARIGTETKEIALIAGVTPPFEANRTV